MTYPATSCPQPWTLEIKHVMYPRNIVIRKTQYKHSPSKEDKQTGGKKCPGQLSNIARQAASDLNSFEKSLTCLFCLPGSPGQRSHLLASSGWKFCPWRLAVQVWTLRALKGPARMALLCISAVMTGLMCLQTLKVQIYAVVYTDLKAALSPCAGGDCPNEGLWRNPTLLSLLPGSMALWLYFPNYLVPATSLSFFLVQQTPGRGTW